MYLQYLSKSKIKRFINTIDENIKDFSITPSKENQSLKVFCLDHEFIVSDFEFNDIKTGISYSKPFRRFMIVQLDEHSKGLGDEYLDNLRKHQEKEPVYGTIL